MNILSPYVLFLSVNFAALAYSIISLPPRQYFIVTSALFSPNEGNFCRIEGMLPFYYELDKNKCAISGIISMDKSLYEIKLYYKTNRAYFSSMSLDTLDYEEMNNGINILLLYEKKVCKLEVLFDLLKTHLFKYKEEVIRDGIYYPIDDEKISQVIIHFSIQLWFLTRINLLVETKESKDDDDYVQNLISCYIDDVHTKILPIVRNETSFVISESLRRGIHTIYLIMKRNEKFEVKWLKENKYVIINNESDNIRSYPFISTSKNVNNHIIHKSKLGYCDWYAKFGESRPTSCFYNYEGEMYRNCTGNKFKPHWEITSSTCRPKLFNKKEYLFYVDEKIMIDIKVDSSIYKIDVSRIPIFLEREGDYLVGYYHHELYLLSFTIGVSDSSIVYKYEFKLAIINHYNSIEYNVSELQFFYRREKVVKPTKCLDKDECYYYFYPSLGNSHISVDRNKGIIAYNGYVVNDSKLNKMIVIVKCYEGNRIIRYNHSNIFSLKYKRFTCQAIDGYSKELIPNDYIKSHCPTNTKTSEIYRKCIGNTAYDNVYWNYAESQCDLYSYCPSFQSFSLANINEKSYRRCGYDHIGYESRECVRISNGKAGWGLINSDYCIGINPMIYYSSNDIHLYVDEAVIIEPIKIYQIKEGSLKMSIIPDGLSFNKYTGAIYGIVRNKQMNNGIIISGIGIDNKEYITSINLLFTSIPTEYIKYQQEYNIFYIGVENMNFTEPTTNGAISEYIINNELPLGLHLNHVTGKIYGKVTAGINKPSTRKFTIIEKRSGIKSYITIQTIQLVCDEINNGGVIWPKTNVLENVVRNCPNEYEGMLKRKCIYENGRAKWSDIDGICQKIDYYCINNLYPKTRVGETAYRECERGLYGSRHSLCLFRNTSASFAEDVDDCRVVFSYKLSIENQIFVRNKPFTIFPSYNDNDNIVFRIAEKVEGIQINIKTGIITGALSIAKPFTVIGTFKNHIGKYVCKINYKELRCTDPLNDYLSLIYERCDNDKILYGYKYRKCDRLFYEDLYDNIFVEYSDYNNELCKMNRNYNVRVLFKVKIEGNTDDCMFQAYSIRNIFVEIMKHNGIALEHSNIIIQKNVTYSDNDYLNFFYFDVFIRCNQRLNYRIYYVLNRVTEDEIRSLQNKPFQFTDINFIHPYIFRRSNNSNSDNYGKSEEDNINNNNNNKSNKTILVSLSIIILILIGIIIYISIKLRPYSNNYYYSIPKTIIETKSPNPPISIGNVEV